MLGKQTRRIIVAAILSLSVYGGTKYWYESTKSGNNIDSNVKPVAYVTSVKENVEKRPLSRLVWLPLNNGEALYPGESIKTSSRGEVRIKFAESDRYLDLDPDSLIVISQSKNEISLDLMNGSVFVAGNDKSTDAGAEQGSKAPALTLKSAKGKVDLSKATASLSKNDKGTVDLQVLKGSATNESGQELPKSAQNDIKIISPLLDEPIIINPENMEPVKFSWQGFPKDTRISLWMGPARNELKQIAQTTEINLTNLEKKLPVGKHFFKLVAFNGDNKKVIESQTYRMEVVPKYAPGIIYPLGDAFILLSKKVNPITFKWSKTDDSQIVTFELAKDAAFKNKVVTKDFEDEESFTQDLPNGDYFWRLSSKYEGLSKPISTKNLRFTVSSKPKVEVQISWLQKDKESVFHYLEKPQAPLSWKADHPEQIKNWKLHVWSQALGREPATDNEKVFDSDEAHSIASMNNPGKYYAKVEGFNENGVLMGESSVRDIEISPLPLLQAPIFQPEAGDLKADNKGNLQLKWTSLLDAKEYYITLRDKEGKELKKAKFEKNGTSLVNLMPGEYKVDVYAVDKHGRESEKSSPRTLFVPETSGLKAPKLKKVKVN